MPADAIVGKKCHELVHHLGAPPDFCPFTKMMQTKQRAVVETDVANEGRWYSITMDPVLDEAGNVTSAVHVATDITDRKRAEERLKQRETELARLAQISMMGEMAGEMAHELNQPLYAITNYAAGVTLRLRDSVADPGQFTEVLEKITGQARRASDIIRRLGNAVRNRAPRRSTTYLNDVLREALEFVGHELRQDSVSVQLDLQESLPAVLADVIQIQQVVLYLIRNAREAMHDVPADQRQLMLMTTTADDETLVQVGVGDTGKGLDTEAGDGIYYPFFATKSQGLGMGLAISRTIVEAHEGRIWATPNTPCGTVFRFVIPTTVEQGSNRAD